MATISGTINHGATLALPTGYTTAQCSWIVSPVRPGWQGTTFSGSNSWDNDDDEYCYVDENRVVQCYHKIGATIYPKTANYFIMGVK